MTVDELKLLLGIENDKDLAELFGKKAESTVSHWRGKRLPPAIILKAREILSERGIDVETIKNRDRGVSATGNGSIVINGVSDPYLPTVMELWHHWSDEQKQEAMLLLLQFNKDQRSVT